MSAKHTPDPWIATPESNGKEWGVDAGRWGICICADAPGTGTAEANARLISASPELLEAARAARDVLATAIRANWEGATDKDIADHVTISRLDKAIAKATGSQS